MSDPREAILARLLIVASGVDETLSARRNETDISDSALPAVILLDGEEIADENDPEGRPANAPRRIAMTPEVQFRLQAKAANVGANLNLYRAKLIKAVLTDATLLALTVNGRSIRYQGAMMAAERGRSMEGGIGVAFTFTYLLRPGDLTEDETA
jgi:hypothetical protein